MVETCEISKTTLPGAVAMGTGVMIGAGIFDLSGQNAELAGLVFSLSLVVEAFVTAFGAYVHIKTPNAFASARGIGMILTNCRWPDGSGKKSNTRRKTP